MTTHIAAHTRPNRDRTRLRLAVDGSMLIAMVWSLMPQATGIPLHEWGSLLVIIFVLAHLVIDWQWIAAVTRGIFRFQPGQTRFNYLWNWLLFVMLVSAVFSGLGISEALLPGLGFAARNDPFWLEVHLFSANSVMIMLGVHLAMHWRWIVNSVKRMYPDRVAPTNR
jgi:hypothetical protein